MMKSFAQSLARRRADTMKVFAEIDPSTMCAQPGGLINHAAWLLGHFHTADLFFLQCATSAEPDMRMYEAYAPGSIPTADHEAKFIELFASYDNAIAMCNASHAKVVETIASMTQADLDRPSPEMLAEFCPTLGDFTMYMPYHEGYHAGQLNNWKLALSKQTANA